MSIDYYQVLEISASANLSEIKAAYRKLAFQYHPDKNPDNPAALSRFELIKEAYETLSDTHKKGRYHEERWLHKANAQPFELPIHSPEDLLQHILLTSNKIHNMDIYRMNKEGIKDALDLLIDEDNIQLLNRFNQTSINDAIVTEALQFTVAIPTPFQQSYLKKLQRIHSNYIPLLQQKEEELAGKIFWETWKPAFILLLVILLCILIWATSLRH